MALPKVVSIIWSFIQVVFIEHVPEVYLGMIVLQGLILLDFCIRGISYLLYFGFVIILLVVCYNIFLPYLMNTEEAVVTPDHDIGNNSIDGSTAVPYDTQLYYSNLCCLMLSIIYVFIGSSFLRDIVINAYSLSSVLILFSSGLWQCILAQLMARYELSRYTFLRILTTLTYQATFNFLLIYSWIVSSLSFLLFAFLWFGVVLYIEKIEQDVLPRPQESNAPT